MQFVEPTWCVTSGPSIARIHLSWDIYIIFASLSFVGNRQVQNDFTSLWMIVEEWIPTVIQSANFSANWFTCEGFLGPDGCVRRLGQIILQLWASLLDALAGWFSPNWFACEEFPQTGLLVAGFYSPQKHGRMAVLDAMAGWFARHVYSTCYCLCFFFLSRIHTLSTAWLSPVWGLCWLV